MVIKPHIFLNERKIFVDKKSLSKDIKTNLNTVELMLAIAKANYKFSNEDLDILLKLDESSKILLTASIMPKYGEIFNPLWKKYDNFTEEERINQYFHYVRRYIFGIDDHNYNLKIDLSEDLNTNTEPKEFKLVPLSFLKEKLNKIYTNISNPTNDEKYLIEKYFKIVKPKRIFNKEILNLYIKLFLGENLPKQEFIKFINDYDFRVVNDLKMFIVNITNIPNDYTLKRNFKVKKFPQYLKTLIMKVMDKLAQNDATIDSISRDRTFWELVQYKIITTQKRYSKYKFAQELFNKVKKRDYSNNSLRKLEGMLTIGINQFNDVFLKFYEYNPTFAFKSLYAILKHTLQKDFNPEVLMQYKIPNLNVCSNTILGLYKRIWGDENHVFKYNGKVISNKKIQKDNVFNDEFNSFTKEHKSKLDDRTLMTIDVLQTKMINHIEKNIDKISDILKI